MAFGVRAMSISAINQKVNFVLRLIEFYILKKVQASTLNNLQSSPYPLQRGTAEHFVLKMPLKYLISNPFLFYSSQKITFFFFDGAMQSPFEGGRGMK